MLSHEIKILGAMETAKAEIDETYNRVIIDLIGRMVKEHHSEDEILTICDRMRIEQAAVVYALESRIEDYKANHNY